MNFKGPANFQNIFRFLLFLFYVYEGSFDFINFTDS